MHVRKMKFIAIYNGVPSSSNGLELYRSNYFSCIHCLYSYLFILWDIPGNRVCFDLLLYRQHLSCIFLLIHISQQFVLSVKFLMQVLPLLSFCYSFQGVLHDHFIHSLAEEMIKLDSPSKLSVHIMQHTVVQMGRFLKKLLLHTWYILMHLHFTNSFIILLSFKFIVFPKHQFMLRCIKFLANCQKCSVSVFGSSILFIFSTYMSTS